MKILNFFRNIGGVSNTSNTLLMPERPSNEGDLILEGLLLLGEGGGFTPNRPQKVISGAPR